MLLSAATTYLPPPKATNILAHCTPGVYSGSDAELHMIPHPDERAGGRKNRRVEEERQCARACSLA